MRLRWVGIGQDDDDSGQDPEVNAEVLGFLNDKIVVVVEAQFRSRHDDDEEEVKSDDPGAGCWRWRAVGG